MIYADRVKETTEVIGTGPAVLDGALFGHRSFISAMPANSTVPYCIASNLEWEIGLGTLTNTTTLARTTVLSSSNNNALVNFSAGTKDVFCTVPASLFAKFLAFNSAELTTANDTAQLLMLDNGEAKPITVANFLTAFGTTAGSLTNAGALTGADVMTVVQGGVEVKTTLSAIAAAVASINGTADTVAPTALSAVVQNGSPSTVSIAMSEALAATTPAASAFTVANHTVLSVAISGSTVNLTVSPAFANGEAASVAGYTKPGANQLQDGTGNQTASFSNLAITNNVAAAGDTTAPTFVSALVANATPTIIELTMSETMANIVPAAAAFAVSGGKTASSVSISGTKVSVTVNSAYVNGDTITVTYTKPGSNPLQDAAGNQTASFGPSSVTNNVAAAGTSYTIAGNAGNTVNATIDGTTPSTTQGSIKGFVPSKQSATAYWTITPTPASARCGWSQSNTVPPADVTLAQNTTSGSSSINGLTPMSHPGAWGNDGYLWVPSGSGTTTWYFWVKPVDGVAQCMNMSGTTVTGA